ncbi:MAG: site-specific DNA-methyltransferase [Bacteroidales bacterium]|nr:site-specific DNA-methyltransferase [Bacteroidales bacterium]
MNGKIKNKIHLADMKDFIKEVADNSIACIFTDVPYKLTAGGVTTGTKSSGMRCKLKWGDKDKLEGRKSGKLFIYNDIEPKEYIPSLYRVLEDTGHIYLMTNNLHLATIQLEMEKAGFIINNILVMVKNNSVTNQHYMKNCEFTIFARKGGSKGLNDFGLKSAMTVEMPRGENKIHDTEKPFSYVKKLIRNSTKKGDTVADFFAGSGNVANACIDLGLDYICCEIDENFHKVAIERIDRAIGDVGLFA